MVLIQLDIPQELDKKIAIKSVDSEVKDKRKVINNILEEYFSI